MTAPQPWPVTRLCPATSNLPTRMLPGSWRTLCASYQRREAVGANRQNGMTPEDFAAISAARFPCAVCAGQALPPGLELITQEEVSEMARTTKRGVCELCGAHANIGVNHGSKVCPSCTHIQSALNKRVEVVAKAARAMHKTEELLGHLIPAGELAVHVTADMLQEISNIVGYDGEDPDELVAAVRKATALGAHQLTSEAEAGALRTIAGIVGYEGTDGEQLVEAVRKQVLTCASCEAEDVLAEIREIVGYTPEQGDKGLADAVLKAVDDIIDFNARLHNADKKAADGGKDCAACTALKGDLLQACELDLDLGTAQDWDYVVAAAIQEIARLTNRKDSWLDAAKLRAELTFAQQARDEWEQRAVQAESNVADQAAELNRLENAPRTDTTYLLDIALRGEGPDADQLASLIEAARRAA